MIHKNIIIEQIRLMRVLCKLNFGNTHTMPEGICVLWKGNCKVSIMLWPWAYSGWSSDKEATH